MCSQPRQPSKITHRELQCACRWLKQHSQQHVSETSYRTEKHYEQLPCPISIYTAPEICECMVRQMQHHGDGVDTYVRRVNSEGVQQDDETE
jgi:hypothetical protein